MDTSTENSRVADVAIRPNMTSGDSGVSCMFLCHGGSYAAKRLMTRSQLRDGQRYFKATCIQAREDRPNRHRRLIRLDEHSVALFSFGFERDRGQEERSVVAISGGGNGTWFTCSTASSSWLKKCSVCTCMAYGCIGCQKFNFSTARRNAISSSADTQSSQSGTYTTCHPLQL